jgi:hypothetical protein
MSATLKHALVSLRELAFTAGPFIALAAALLAAAYYFLQPNPPRRVVLATGVEQGAYAEFGRRYAEILSAHGITVELRGTQGAAENLALLRRPDSGIDIGFVQGGADGSDAAIEPNSDGLVSLGSVFNEPVWLFYREPSAQRLLGAPMLSALNQLPGWKVNVGAAGSGVPPLVQRLLEANHVESATLALSRQPVTPAVVDLLEGRLDALVLASAPESAMVQMLLMTPGIRLFDFAQAEAYSRRFTFLAPLVLPRGVVDLARDLPPADVHLVAPKATLVARKSLHPALVQLFVQAAQQVHGGAGWFQRKGDFPNASDTERPMADEALRIYRNGVPWLQRYLPFWMANLADRMWVVVLGLLAVLIPISRVVPPLYQFRIRSRVFRWYGQLREVETALGQQPAAELLKKLDEIEAGLGHVTVPLSYTDELYALRGHIQLVRARVNEAPA